MGVLATPLDQISAIWNEVIWGDVIIDGVGLDSPVMATMMKKCKTPWPGGTSVREPYTYKYTNVTATGMGAEFTYADEQFVSGSRMTLREYHGSVADYLENLEVYYKGDSWAYNNMNIKAEQAMRSLYAAIAVALYADGQAVAPTTGSPSTATDNRLLQTNGADEAMNDGYTPGWQGKIFLNYLEVTRNTGQAGVSKNSTPVYCNQSGGSAGPITFPILCEREADVNVNGKLFDLCTTTRQGLALAKEAIAQRQIIIETTSPYFGVKGVQFGSGMIVADELAPSRKYGNNGTTVNGNIIIPNQNYLTASFTCPASMPATSGLSDKNGQTIIVGETMWFWNTGTWKLFMPTSPMFAFGLGQFRQFPMSTQVVADIFAMLTFACNSNRNNGAIFGFGDSN